MANELSLSIKPTEIAKLQDVANQCSLAKTRESDAFQQAFLMSAGMRQLGELITDKMMTDVVSLMNTSLGFKTDKDPAQIDWKTKKPHVPYELGVVKRCFIEAVLHGVRPVGNEFNIIAGGCYITKNGFRRLLKEFEGLTDFSFIPDVPVMKQNGAVVHCKANWNLNGKNDSLEIDIPIKVNDKMGIDAIRGKAERKMLAAVYGKLTGSESTPEGEIENGMTIEGSITKRSEVTDNLPPASDEPPPRLSEGELFEKENPIHQ